jgi:serine/threonine-protein kinase HipA
MDGDRLLIAKFPHRHDDVDVMAWEYVSLMMAKDAGIRVPDCRLEEIEGQHVLLLARFDREECRRIGYISAMTLLGRSDGAEGDYTEIALRIRDVSARAHDDLHELFRRIVFSVLINNTDDHLRNHGFLREGSGWRLSPVFDVNPNPNHAAVRVTGIYGERAREQALAALLANAEDFDLSFGQAKHITSEVSAVVASFQTYANTVGIPLAEQTRFRTVIRSVCDCWRYAIFLLLFALLHAP